MRNKVILLLTVMIFCGFAVYTSGVYEKAESVMMRMPQGNDNTKVPILMYHAFTTDTAIAAENLLYVTDKTFERQMAEVREKGYTPIFIQELGGTLPEKPIAITMDDGYEDNFTIAFPLLKKYNVKATIFIIASARDNPAFFDWQQAREMVESGIVDIQSHTFDMHSGEGLLRDKKLSKNDQKAKLLGDFSKSSEAFLKELGYEPAIIAYPHGEWDVNIVNIYKDKFKYGVCIGKRVANMKQNRMLLTRISINEKSVIEDFY